MLFSVIATSVVEEVDAKEAVHPKFRPAGVVLYQYEACPLCNKVKGDKSCINSELWHACTGPLVSLPSLGSHVVYFSSEQHGAEPVEDFMQTPCVQVIFAQCGAEETL